MISACLIGIRCRYDGGHSKNPAIVDFIGATPFIPFCPEQMGGLPTPRSPANIKGGDGYDVLRKKAALINNAGEDVTDAFRKGAEEAYSLALLVKSPLAVMKSRSPSCGLRTPYCEKEAGWGTGVTAALFASHGVKIVELDSEDPFPNQNFLRLLEKLDSSQQVSAFPEKS